MSDFSAGIAAYAKRTKLSIDDAIISINSQAATSIIKRTPVDTGRAKGNWIPTISSSSSIVREEGYATEQEAISESVQIASMSAGKVFYLTNNLPYIILLEHFHSKQAPAGMVGLTVIETRSRIRKELESR